MKRLEKEHSATTEALSSQYLRSCEPGGWHHILSVVDGHEGMNSICVGAKNQNLKLNFHFS